MLIVLIGMKFTKYPNDFWRKRKIDHFEPYNATNIAAAGSHIYVISVFCDISGIDLIRT